MIMKELLKILKQFGIYSEYLKILDVELDGDRYITILTPTTLNWIEEEEIEETLEEIFKNVRVKISRLPLNKFIKIYLERNVKNKAYGENIENVNIEGENYALYIDWKNKKIVIHKFNGKTPIKESCKLSSNWETMWGIWVLGFESKDKAKEFAEKLADEIYKYYGIDFDVVEHKRCLSEN